jgi:hypothetical protein
VPKEVEGDFGRTVVEPLLGREQLPEMEKVTLEREWVEQLVERLRDERVRPSEREEEDEVDVEAREAVVVEDLLSGEGILAVEIKVRCPSLPFPFLPLTLFTSPSAEMGFSPLCRPSLPLHQVSQDLLLPLLHASLLQTTRLLPSPFRSTRLLPRGAQSRLLPSRPLQR